MKSRARGDHLCGPGPGDPSVDSISSKARSECSISRITGILPKASGCASASSASNLHPRSSRPVQPSFFLSPPLITEPSLTLNLCFCITGLVCIFFSSPPSSLSVCWALFCLSLLPPRLAVETARRASLSALFCTEMNSSSTTANKQRRKKKERKKGGEAGGTVHSTTVPFKTVAMETPLSSPLMCVYIAGFDRQIKAHWGKRVF